MWLLSIILISFLLIGGISSSNLADKAEIKLTTDAESEKATLKEHHHYDHFRLPTSIQPEKYKLEIITHLNDSKGFEFTGKVYIQLIVNENTNNITLHAKNLTIDQSQITITPIPSTTIDNDSTRVTKNISQFTDEYKIENIETIPNHDYYVIHLNLPLMKLQKYQLFIPFSSELNKNLFGYYRSSYISKKTNQRTWLSVTQFEPTTARLAFPCFDEPEMKAKFHIFLAHDKKYTALSNMPLKSTKEMENEIGWVWDEFEESVPMSTYLVAYSVNDFGYKESMAGTKESVRFRTWARKDALFQTDYARELGPRVLKYYEDYFDIKFPMPKIDQIALPDFSAGAMENWGLVTYRETALLFAKNASTFSNKHRVASVISHELAHQWFGNLVTMKWWTDLWLNEGFATYVASLGVEYLHPEWNSLIEESVENTLNIFKVDALKSSHPISIAIGHASEISQIFDAISYSKGSCVIRMMHLFLGEETFRRGVSNYLKQYAYKNAEQDNLWSSLTQVAHTLKTIPDDVSIKQIMDSWTLQTGYPVITIVRDYTTGSAIITQSRYLLDTYAARDSFDNCWYVPLSYTTQSEANFNSTHPQEWLQCENKEVVPITKDYLANSDEWVIFNIQLSGLYKVKYDERNWDLLIETLMSPEYTKIHLINRAQLIDDALDLAWTGDQDYSIAMRIIAYLKQEREYIPWRAALDNLSAVNRILRMTPDYQFFKTYMRKILAPIYETLQGLNASETESERLDVVKHKVLVASWSCRFEVADCVTSAKDYFQEWSAASNPDHVNPIPLDLRSVVYCTAVRHGNDVDWNFLWNRYKNSNVAAEKQTILSSLGCSRDIWVLQRYLTWGFNETSGIRKQDSYIVFGAVARGDIGFHLARDYFLDNIQEIYKYFAPDTSKLSRFIRPIANQMTTDKDLEMMRKFTKSNAAIFEKSSESVKRALETIEVNSQWKARNYNDISKQLQRFIKNY